MTIGDTTYPLGEPFLVLATQNPIEHEGTYPLPEAQLDRFLMQIRVDYPSRDEELEVLKRGLERSTAIPDAVIDARSLAAAKVALGLVRVDPKVQGYLLAGIGARVALVPLRRPAQPFHPRRALRVLRRSRRRRQTDVEAFYSDVSGMVRRFVEATLALASPEAEMDSLGPAVHDLRRFQQWNRLGRPDSERNGDAPSWNRVVLVAISACCCGVAAMVPGVPPTAVGDQDPGSNLVIALDTSKSMYASDIRPSRIHEAVRQLHGVLRAAPVARVAIVGFAGSSAILCPLTDDRDAASECLDQLERDPVGGRGSDLGLGLRRAADAFGAAGGERLVLLVSDGEGTGAELEAAVIRIKGEGVRVLDNWKATRRR